MEVTPGSATLAGGATQQFTAVGRMSDESTQAVSGDVDGDRGHVTTGGLYTAGSTAGTLPGHRGAAGGHEGGYLGVTITARGADVDGGGGDAGDGVGGGGGDAAVHGGGADE